MSREQRRHELKDAGRDVGMLAFRELIGAIKRAVKNGRRRRAKKQEAKQQRKAARREAAAQDTTPNEVDDR